MKIDKEEGVIYFDTDDELTDFCLYRNPIIKQGSSGTPYYDYEYTPLYYQAINDGYNLCMCDKKSKALKRKCVCRSAINKPIDII